jgi:hypothetical protein
MALFFGADSAIRLYLFLAKEARKRIPLLSELGLLNFKKGFMILLYLNKILMIICKCFFYISRINISSFMVQNQPNWVDCCYFVADMYKLCDSLKTLEQS